MDTSSNTDLVAVWTDEEAGQQFLACYADKGDTDYTAQTGISVYIDLGMCVGVPKTSVRTLSPSHLVCKRIALRG